MTQSSATCLSKHGFLELREMNLEKIPLIAAAVQAGASFRVADQLEFRVLQLEGVAEGLGFQLAGVEQELVDGNGEQGLCQLSDAGLQEVVG